MKLQSGGLLTIFIGIRRTNRRPSCKWRRTVGFHKLWATL